MMSSVVGFLTMLEQDVQESNGNVRRMLSVCSEFERIAKVALDKAEREMRGRGKRKQAERDREKDRLKGAVSAEIDDGKTLEQLQIETQASYRRPVQTPSLKAASMSGSGAGASASPASWNGSQPGGDRLGYAGPGAGYAKDQRAAVRTPDLATQFSMPQGSQAAPYATSVDQAAHQMARTSAGDFMQTLGDGFVDAGSTTRQANINGAIPDMGANEYNNFTSPDANKGAIESSFGGSFQQPFVPQDLWQMPMTLEWDWAEGLGLGSFTPGPMLGDDVFSMGEAQAQQGMQQGMPQDDGGYMPHG